MPVASEVRRPSVLPPRRYRVESNLLLDAPLWHPDLSISPFLTKDPTHHSCTVTGAVWGTTGRTFDAVDDKIALPVAVYQAFANTNDFTIELWAYIETTPDGGFVYWASKNIVSNQPSIQFYVNANRTVSATVRHTAGDSVQNTFTSAAQAVGWHQLVLKWEAATHKLYLDIDGVNSGSDATNILTFAKTDFDLANIGSGKTGASYGEKIGEVRIYSRLLSISEVMQNYLATKWRYQ